MTEMPRRPHQQFTLRLPPELHTRLAAAAEREHRSMTGQALHILEAWLAQEERARRRLAEERGEHHAGEAPPDEPEEPAPPPRELRRVAEDGEGYSA